MTSFHHHYSTPLLYLFMKYVKVQNLLSEIFENRKSSKNRTFFLWMSSAHQSYCLVPKLVLLFSIYTTQTQCEYWQGSLQKCVYISASYTLQQTVPIVYDYIRYKKYTTIPISDKFRIPKSVWSQGFQIRECVKYL